MPAEDAALRLRFCGPDSRTHQMHCSFAAYPSYFCSNSYLSPFVLWPLRASTSLSTISSPFLSFVSVPALTRAVRDGAAWGARAECPSHRCHSQRRGPDVCACH